MRDGPIRRTIKRVTLCIYYLDKWLLCLFRKKTVGERRYVLTGTCDPCGKCCETPAIQIPSILFFLPILKRLFIIWQVKVNGFEFIKEDRQSGCILFSCSHYDPITRLCDSYKSRPGMCRDYPIILLKSPCPVLFSECSYCVVDKRASTLKSYLDSCNIPEEKRKKLYQKLYIEDNALK